MVRRSSFLVALWVVSSACPAEPEPDDGGGQTTVGSCGQQQTMSVERPQRVVEAALDGDGEIAADECMTVCDIFLGDVLECRLLELPEATSGGATTGIDTGTETMGTESQALVECTYIEKCI